MTRPMGRRWCYVAGMATLLIVAASLYALPAPRDVAATHGCVRKAATVAICHFQTTSSILGNTLTSIAITLNGSAHETLTSSAHWWRHGSTSVSVLVRNLAADTPYSVDGTAYWAGGGNRGFDAIALSRSTSNVPPAVFGVRVGHVDTGDRVAWDPPARFYSKVEIERETLVEYPSGASLWANGVVFTYTPTLEYVVEAFGDGSYDLHTTDSSTRAYTDTTATDSSTYRYRVRTLDGDTGGAWSVWRTTVGSEAAQTVSSVPFNLDVIRTADGTAATLSWDAVPRDVTKYMLRREEMVLRANQIQPSWTETKTFDVVATGTGDVPTTYTDQGIDEDTTYRYRVAAVDPAGQGPFSDPVETAGHQDPTSVVDRTGLFTTPSLEGYSPGLNATGDAQGYEIKISAPSSAWPIRVEVHEGRSVRLSDAGTATSCSNLEEDLTVTKATAKFWLYACHAGELTTLQLRRDGDRALLAEYRVYTKSSKVPPPTPSGPGAIGTPSADDPLGIEPIIEEIMSNAGIDYDMGLLKNFLVVAGAVGVAAIPLLKGGRGPSGIVIAFLVFNMVLWLGGLWMGFPWYWALIPTALTVGLGAMAGLRSMAGVGGGA